MPTSVILRFRDFEDNHTIQRHQELIEKCGSVWWGWWKKSEEAFPRGFLEQLSSLANAQLEVGLFNRQTGQFYNARITKCVFDETTISSPEPRKTPSYYVDKKLPGWFEILKIKEVGQEEFSKSFIDPPGGEWTLYPVKEGVNPFAIKPDAMRLQGSRILHLSDVHLGADYGFPGSAGGGDTPLVEVIRRDLFDQDVGLIVFSGDLTTRGDASILQDNGVEFLKDLASTLKLPIECVVVVPGNHDIPLKSFEPHAYTHERSFNLFLQEFYGRKIGATGLQRFVFPNGRNLDLLRINSIKRRDITGSNFGYVEWSSYDELLRDWPNDPETVRIAVLHHHLVPALQLEKLDDRYPEAGLSLTLDAGAVVEGLNSHGFHMALHGHQHVPGVTKVSRVIRNRNTNQADFSQPLAIVAAGSAGSSRLSDAMRENSYNLISIDAHKIQIDVRKYNKAVPVSRHYLCSV